MESNKINFRSQWTSSAISSWCEQWNLGLNYKKCSAVHFSTKSSQQSNVYTIGIPFLESQRDLGVTVSGTLSWSQQCDTVCSKAYGALYVLRRNVHTTSSITIKKQLYLSLVKSSISYCCQLWRPHLCKNIQSIEIIQRRATKYILKDYTSDYKSRLLSLHMLPLMLVRPTRLMIKFLKDPQDTINVYQYIRFVNSNTRAGKNPKMCHRFTRLRNFYFVRIVRLWNSIINLTLSVHANKAKLRHFLWKHFELNFNCKNMCSYHYLCPCYKCIV